MATCAGAPTTRQEAPDEPDRHRDQTQAARDGRHHIAGGPRGPGRNPLDGTRVRGQDPAGRGRGPLFVQPLQGFTGSGKSYLGCALAKQACQHRIRAHYIRMPDLEEAWALAKDKPLGSTKFLKKYAAFTLLVIDEWLLDHPDESMRSMLLELLERRYGNTSTVFCTQYAQKDWHQRLGSGVHADAIMDRIVHNTLWIESGSFNMREHTAMNGL